MLSSDISGFAGACLSFDFTVFTSEIFLPSLATAFTSVSFWILSAGILIKPESSSMLTPSTAGSIFHLPPTFLAVIVSVFSLGVVYVTSISDVLSSFGPTTTLPSSSAATFGASSFLTTVSACTSNPLLFPEVTDTEPSFATSIV